LLFDITQKADTAHRWNDTTKHYQNVDYTFEEQHKWLGWQARQRILDFLDEAVNDPGFSVKAFAFDLDEPEICKRFLKLAGENRLKMTLDDAGKHGIPTSFESVFQKRFTQGAANAGDIHRGHFSALAHCKVFIQVRNSQPLKANVMHNQRGFGDKK
jgi:hypothetical protein